MEKKKLREIAEGKDNELLTQKFDEYVSSEMIKSPSLNFTSSVMGALNTKTQSRSGFIQVWSIIIGVMVAIILWAMEGFVTPEISVPINLPQVESVNMGNMMMVLMSANALLVLFLIDRWFQHRKRTA